MTRWIGVVVGLTLVVPALAWPQSLGSVARKEAERRQKNKENGVQARTFDSESIGEPDDPEDESETGDKALSAQGPAREDSEDMASSPMDEAGAELEREREQRVRDEAEWRKRFSEAEGRLEQAQRKYDAVKDLRLVGNEYYVDSQGRPVIRSVEELQRIVDEARTELEAAQTALEDLHESARREGVPPGWLR